MRSYGVLSFSNDEATLEYSGPKKEFAFSFKPEGEVDRVEISVFISSRRVESHQATRGGDFVQTYDLKKQLEEKLASMVKDRQDLEILLQMVTEDESKSSYAVELFGDNWNKVTYSGPLEEKAFSYELTDLISSIKVSKFVEGELSYVKVKDRNSNEKYLTNFDATIEKQKEVDRLSEGIRHLRGELKGLFGEESE